MSDAELLQSYIRENSQAAFAALVSRHVDLVYSAALRQVRSPHLAEDVAQSVFIALARGAAKIPSTQPLAAWLYVVTRRTAIDAFRQEMRRRNREAVAAEFAAMKTPPEAWAKIEAAIDEAMETLAEPERSALVLRFFQNQSLREVGASLGISEDTAQKRVSRALDRLRTFFLRRGVPVAAATLAADLSAQAVQVAPVGLAATISSSVATLPAVIAVAAKHFAMTATQKILSTAAVGAALALAVSEGTAALRVRSEVLAGQQRIDALADTARQLRLDQTAAARKLADLRAGRRAGQTTPESDRDAALEREATAWVGRLARLKQALAQDPAQNIPELQLLTESDWLLASLNEDFSRPERIAESLRLLRTRAKSAFAQRVFGAVQRPFARTQGASPSDFDQFVRLLDPPIDPAILARYEFQKENGRLIVAEKLGDAADQDRLTLVGLAFTKERGLTGYAGSETATARVVREAAQAYATAKGGTPATDAAQLLPFLPQPMDAAELAKIFAALPLSLGPAQKESP